MRTALTCILAILIGIPAIAKPAPRKKDAPELRSAVAESGVTTPASVPLNARLIANETMYHLDRGGLTPVDFRKQLDAGKKSGRLAAAPRVDLIFELHNTGKEELQVLIGGDTSGTLRWQLSGPGAVSHTFRPVVQTDDLKEPTVVKIPAGGCHRWVYKSLDCSGPRDTSRAYWTQAGEYLLAGGFTVAVKPAPKGTVPHWYHKDHGNVAISSGKVRLVVVDD
ncbi:MAG: hypothetical protein HY289_11290 [Planctomycetes bacterium]|nr:hypothetical protein [Planctomycetota bacterium]